MRKTSSPGGSLRFEVQQVKQVPLPPQPLDERLSRVAPGPDVLLSERAESEIEEWIAGWRAAERLADVGVSLPGPLFLHGPPGTGKTAVTKMIARRLEGDREVLVIDAMRVTKAYMGATSSSIAEAADAALRSGGVLVIEEIDTLASMRAYGSSAEVENSRSTTSIMRVLELAGPIVLTSNRLDVIDPAVIRRCEFIVEMPVPRPDQCRAIVARELGDDPGPVSVSVSLSVAIPLARRARRTAALGGKLAVIVFADLVARHG